MGGAGIFFHEYTTRGRENYERSSIVFILKIISTRTLRQEGERVRERESEEGGERKLPLPDIDRFKFDVIL